jgi:hypothetical protein
MTMVTRNHRDPRTPSEMPRAEIKALLAQHILEMEQLADSFPERVRAAGGPVLDFSEESLEKLYKYFDTFRVPERMWEHDAFVAQSLPWWVGWYGGYVAARRIGPDLCWFVHECCAYVARCYRTISPKSKWVIHNAARNGIEYNRITFEIHNGPYADILWDTFMSFAVCHFPDRDPTNAENALMPSGPRAQLPLLEIFRRKQLLVLPEGHPDLVAEESEFELLSPDGRVVVVTIREDLAHKRGWTKKFIASLQGMAQVESVEAQDREVIIVTFRSEETSRDAERYVSAAAAQV